MRSSRHIFKILTAVGGVLGLLMVNTTASVAVGVPVPPVGAYDDIKHDVARRGGGRMAGRGGGRRGGFRRGRGGGRAFRGHKRRFQALHGRRRGHRFKFRRPYREGRYAVRRRGARHDFRGPKHGGYRVVRGRGPRHGLGGLGWRGRYARLGERPANFRRHWHRRKYARHVRGKYGRFGVKKGYWSNLRYGKYRRHKYGYRYRDGYDFGHRGTRYPWLGLPWAFYYGGGTPEEFVCRKLYETALIVNNAYYWDDYYASCDDPEAYAWFEAYLPPPDLPLQK